MPVFAGLPLTGGRISGKLVQLGQAVVTGAAAYSNIITLHISALFISVIGPGLRDLGQMQSLASCFF
jgi:hypothetical protein